MLHFGREAFVHKTQIEDKENIFKPAEIISIKPTSFFIRKRTNQWIEEAKKRPIPNMLFGEFWYEGEVCVLFGDSNCGKSILAVQVGNAISQGSTTVAGAFKSQATSQKVLYFDFELSDKQFEQRYSDDYQDHYIFHDNFFRLEINPDMKVMSGVPYEEIVVGEIEKEIKETNAGIVIIDNITFLRNDNTQSKDAIMLMKQLKELKNRHNLSMLILAHTPKRNQSFPLNQNDLSGSKMLMNFCDSAVAIGRSCKDKAYCYLKQIKARSTPIIYGDGNVGVCKIEKEFNFLQYKFIEYSKESEHLKQLSDSKEYEDNLILEMNKAGKTNIDIAQVLNCSEGTVRNRLKKLQKDQGS